MPEDIIIFTRSPATGSKLPDRDQGRYSVTRKIFGTERFSRQTTVHVFLTYIFSYALNKQFEKAAAIDQTTGRDRLNNWPRSTLWPPLVYTFKYYLRT
jgi:hypothetical protein